MRIVWLGLALLGLGLSGILPATAAAQDRKFPYEAIVDVDSEYVRCGPGPKYYPTSKLARGEKVMVHRHDPGGWVMIAPPADSFSWIQADYVQKLESGRGSLTANNVIVHVGSALGDERSVYQRTLSKGDTVEILQQAKLTTERGPMTMYKIKPPPREYRWIATKAIVPGTALKGGGPLKPPSAPLPNITGPVAAADDLDPTTGPDPFAPAVPKNEANPGSATTKPVSLPGEPNGPTLTFPGETPTSPANPAPEDATSVRQRFDALDRELRSMLEQDPGRWEIERIETGLEQLEPQADTPGLRGLIQFRLRQLKKYRKVQNDFREFSRITSQTKQRDAELIALQQQTESQLRQIEAGDPIAAAPPSGLPATPVSTPATGGPPVKPATNPALPRPTFPAAAPKFDGAGIVQAVKETGKPGYALYAPDGRLLTYLVPPDGLDLAPYINFAMGVTGPRAKDEQLGADVLQVRSMQPVQLRGTKP